jgi:hypothetical protein
VSQEVWRFHHMDVKSAFLNSDFKEEVYVRQPPDYAVTERRQGVPPTQGPLRLALGPACLEREARCHAQGHGFPAECALGGGVPAGQRTLCPARRHLRRQLDHHWR